MITILEGDNMEHMKDLPSGSFDACVTDPPYGLKFMSKKWDSSVPGVETWREVWRVLKPGAHLVAFFGTRTYHRGVVAIEDAGFDIRDQLAWVYGSGFPKSHDIGKATGLEAWEGWGTALKPAWEPIVLARKPFPGTVAENVCRCGCGGLNIDACRVGSDEMKTDGRKCGGEMCYRDGRLQEGYRGGTSSGRFPANLCHDGSAEVLAQFPHTSSNSGNLEFTNRNQGVAFGQYAPCETSGITDSGSAARFFYTAKASKSDREEWLHDFTASTVNDGRTAPHDTPHMRADTQRKNLHPTVKPTDLMRWLCRLVTPPGGHILDPFAGSGSTGKAAMQEGFRATLIELDPQHAATALARCQGQPGLGI